MVIQVNGEWRIRHVYVRWCPCRVPSLPVRQCQCPKLSVFGQHIIPHPPIMNVLCVNISVVSASIEPVSVSVYAASVLCMCVGARARA
jgi:hypothetical protein